VEEVAELQPFLLNHSVTILGLERITNLGQTSPPPPLHYHPNDVYKPTTGATSSDKKKGQTSKQSMLHVSQISI
jgi:hypothetical protein